ncbi:G5 domain-containing protein [Bifidobacterium pullorum]|uniref:aggregation-promoting factor C-terminal-like domain-containing protein n=1 Tax=Bifidobacterium pullorum TaxID=78448 RepID=UPI000529E977|nr:G5 domain-containing protein [Bifidobacterium pullorum]
MANHRRKRTLSLPSLTKRHWIRIAAAAAALALAATGGITARHFWVSAHAGDEAQQITSFSATDPLAVSRGNERTNGGETSYVTVKLDGESRTVLGTDFTTVKSVLEAGNITLGPDDTVDPALDTEVDESTVITIETAGSALETSEEPIAFSTVKKETSALPEGTEQVQTEGEEGVMETTSLVTRAGDKVISSNVFASYVKKEPVDKVILVGTGATASSTASDSSSSSGSGSSSSAGASIGTTVPAGEMQQWAHDYLLANGYTEADFSATVYIINHESGWRVNATNASSGAYGLPQALPGNKMASAGADWATNYQTQLKWFWSYCNSRYGSVQGAYNFWVANHWY